MNYLEKQGTISVLEKYSLIGNTIPIADFITTWLMHCERYVWVIMGVQLEHLLS